MQKVYCQDPERITDFHFGGPFFIEAWADDSYLYSSDKTKKCNLQEYRQAKINGINIKLA